MVRKHRRGWWLVPIGLLLALPLALGAGCSKVPGAGVSHNPAANARHIILFIGDGMQLEHELALSRYLTGTDAGLVWNKFPYQGPVATWDISTYNRYAQQRGVAPFRSEAFDPQVGYDPHQGGGERHPLDNSGNEQYFLLDRFAADSASAATAMATGIKTEAGKIAWSAGAPVDGPLKTIAELMREQRGSAIGVVSTVPFNHATPAAFVSHNSNRNHYFSGKIPGSGQGIAEEILRVSRPEVVIGGGHPAYNGDYLPRDLFNDLESSSEYLLVARATRVDGGRALLAASRQAIAQGKKLFGLFGGPGGNFEPPRPQHNPGRPTIHAVTEENPTLAQATTAALQHLAEDRDGFFLLIEQGDIDWANHNNDYAWMLGAMGDLHQAVEAAIAYIDLPGDRLDWDNTLLMVTSDHGNSYMRLDPLHPLHKGELPGPSEIARWDQSPQPGTKVSYRTNGHSNELVSLYAKSSAVGLFRQYQGSWYPGTTIIDNTQIFKVMQQFALDGHGDSFAKKDPLP